MRFIKNTLLAVAVVSVAGCTTVKYNTLEKIGIHKRDLLVGNVEDTRDAQKDAQKEFKDALERFGSVVSVEETKLKKAYERLSDEYDDAKDAADEVSEQIEETEDVARDLFKEWREEIKTYSDAVLKRDSENKLRDTEARYEEMHKSMKQAEASMQPVLSSLHDNVLYLKHNLNAQAVGSLRSTYRNLEGYISVLVERMNKSISRSNDFIKQMK